MPYKLSENGKSVLVKRGARWVILKTHPSKTKALAHLQALNRNVRHGQ